MACTDSLMPTALEGVMKPQIEYLRASPCLCASEKNSQPAQACHELFKDLKVPLPFSNIEALERYTNRVCGPALTTFA